MGRSEAGRDSFLTAGPGTLYCDHPFHPDGTTSAPRPILWCGVPRRTPTPAYVSAPANAHSQAVFAAASAIPIRRAEELLCSLPGVISARILADSAGAISEIHVLTSLDVAPKQTVRNIESALIAHLGVRVDHRKISVATTVDPPRPRLRSEARGEGEGGGDAPPAPLPGEGATVPEADRRRIYFEDIEVRRSRSRGVSCRVTLRKGDASYSGEAEGMENERSRVELAARATLHAIMDAEDTHGLLALDGVTRVSAFDREFALVAVSARMARMSALLTGTCEIRESLETAGALAVLDATNRWLAHER